jgi:hypothetical protein
MSNFSSQVILAGCKSWMLHCGPSDAVMGISLDQQHCSEFGGMIAWGRRKRQAG